ncbi:MAG: GNAT family N-acetyltransferase [Anaerolineae bacterium]|nr:GNAT family N-acetyltransferase [Candidatus Roseilinea sp.]MDW8449090.1 GNAT family N-acetyltransferase [Anaerolineae bacterium]
MVADARTVFSPADPHIRQIDPWRDGRAVANLLETSFRDEAMNDDGIRLIHALRNYGLLDALTLGGSTGFVWVEEGQLIANASVQRNYTRRDTWIIGNVATQPAYRNRGIGRAVVEACIQYAASRGAHYIALQADVNNKPALHLYEKLGFQRLGEVTHYLRPAELDPPDDELPRRTRKARWSDRAAVWALAQRNVPERFTFAEPFDANMYRLGLRWSLLNALNGNIEQWRVMDAGKGGELLGAVRTRATFEGSYHHLEVLPNANATVEDAVHLIESGLRRLEDYATKPVYAAHACIDETPHAALRAAGFRPTRTLVHMRLELDECED